MLRGSIHEEEKSDRKKKREEQKTEIKNIREKVDITNIKKYRENDINSYMLINFILNRMNTFLERQKLLKITQEEIDNLNRLFSNDINNDNVLKNKEKLVTYL